MRIRGFCTCAAVALGLLGTACLSKAQNAEVDWSSDGDVFVENATTSLLSAGDLVLIGSFNEGFTAIQANANPSAWMSHFAEFGQTTIGTGVGGSPGEFAAITQASSSSTTPFAVANQRIYVVVLNASTVGAATQEAILSLSSDSTHSSPASSWTFPADNTNNNKTVIDLQDLTSGAFPTRVLTTDADVVWGAFDAVNQNFATAPFAAIPEPSIAALLLLGSLAVPVLSRRLRK